MGGDRQTKLQKALHRRILVGTVANGLGGRFADRLGTILIRETLAEIDRVMCGGQRGHCGEYRCAQAAENRITFLPFHSLVPLGPDVGRKLANR